MNQQALFDGVLAIVAVWAAWFPGRRLPALRLGAALLATAAVLGVLRFSGVLAVTRLHMAMSMFGACVGLPLIAAAMVWPGAAVAQERRYAWTFAVTAAVLSLLVVVVAEVKVWSAACPVLSVAGMLVVGLCRRQWWALAAAVSMLAALGAAAVKWRLGPLAPGDLLHLGLALGLWLYVRWARLVQPPPHLSPERR